MIENNSSKKKRSMIQRSTTEKSQLKVKRTRRSLNIMDYDNAERINTNQSVSNIEQFINIDDDALQFLGVEKTVDKKKISGNEKSGKEKSSDRKKSERKNEPQRVERVMTRSRKQKFH